MTPFYREYLDTEINRRGTHCVKWDNAAEIFGREDLEAAWVADMDWRTSPAIIEAIQARAAHGIFGYTDDVDEARAAEVGWLKRRHGLDVDPKWILSSPGVVDSLYICVREMTGPDDAVLVQPPVYGPFYHAAETFGRRIVRSPLTETADGWRIDFDDLDRKMADGVKMMILCNPHNPVGRVWTREELQQVVDLANRHGVILVSDEIHADFAFDGRHTTRILSLEHTDSCVMLTSATKSFNIAGLRNSSCIIANEALRRQFEDGLNKNHAHSANLFGAVAQKAAYTRGDEWLDAVLEYIRENRDFAVDYVNERIPGVTARPQESTYVMWLDFRGTGLSDDGIRDVLINRAHVALSDGRSFGEEGSGFVRMIIAQPRVSVARILGRIEAALREAQP